MAEYIEREAAIEACCGDCNPAMCSCDCDEVAAIRYVPAADVQPVRNGRWARLDKRRGSYLFYCSECGGRAYYVHGVRKSEPVCGYRYCPNCGAKMDGGET